MRLRRLRPRSASTAAAVVLLILLGSVVLLYGGLGTSGGVFSVQREVGERAYRGLDVGRSRESIEEQLGTGQDALEYRMTGFATEPMDADCLYWPAEGFDQEIVQLCFRGDRLVRKRIFPSG